MDTKSKLGVAYVLLYCLVTAMSTVLISMTEQSTSSFYISFYSVLVSTLFFSVYLFKDFSSVKSLVKDNLAPILKINITTALIWLIIFYTLKTLDPVIVIVLFMGAVPVTSAFLTRKQVKSVEERNFDFWTALLILLLLVLSIADDFSRMIHVAQAGGALSLRGDLIHWSLDSLLVLSSGVITAYNNIYAKQLSQNGMSAPQVLAVRFYLLLLLSLGLIFLTGHNLAISSQAIGHLVIVAVLSIALPLYLLQKGIEKIEPMHVSFILPLMPMMVFCFQLFRANAVFHWDEFLLVMLICLVIGYAAIQKGKYAQARVLETVSE